MSVLVRCVATGAFLVLTKGAEEAVFACLAAEKTSRPVREANEVLKRFGRRGWRTLAVAYRLVDERECGEFVAEVENAMNDLDKRGEALSKAYEKLERGMQLLGTTAVEDRLQEDVGKTLVALRAAGIKVSIEVLNTLNFSSK